MYGLRRCITAVLAVALAAVGMGLATLVSGGPGAHAAAAPPAGSTGTTNTGPPPPSNCKDDGFWDSPPRLVVHTGEFLNDVRSTNPALDEVYLLDAANDIVNQFNSTGGTSAKITSVTASSEPFTFEHWFNDATPTIHVGFTNNIRNFTDDPNADGLTSPYGTINVFGCEMERHIVFTTGADPNGHDWDMRTPADIPCTTGSSLYYDAGPTDCNGYSWFRPSLLHELLHAFGYQHTKTQYAFMNHRGTGGFPWANRGPDQQIRPLPYDVSLLRRDYPGTGTRYDVAVLNTWYTAPTDSTDDAAHQVKLCKPSLGASWASSTSSGTCGLDGTDSGATSVCVGDTLKTRYTLANYSTGSVTVNSSLWMSTDEAQGVDDTPSSTSARRDDIPAATSLPVKAEWKVPDLTGKKLHPIILITSNHQNADGSIDPKSETKDSIPLRGTITVKHC
jgi:hypothetical protein